MQLSLSSSRIANRRFCLAALASAGLLLLPSCVHGQAATLVADTAVDTGRASVNFGSLSNLYVSGTSTALLRFDLGTLPSGTTGSQISRPRFVFM